MLSRPSLCLAVFSEAKFIFVQKKEQSDIAMTNQDECVRTQCVCVSKRERHVTDGDGVSVCSLALAIVS